MLLAHQAEEPRLFHPRRTSSQLAALQLQPAKRGEALCFPARRPRGQQLPQQRRGHGVARQVEVHAAQEEEVADRRDILQPCGDTAALAGQGRGPAAPRQQGYERLHLLGQRVGWHAQHSAACKQAATRERGH